MLIVFFLASPIGQNTPSWNRTYISSCLSSDLLDGDLVFRTGTGALAGIVLAYGEGTRFSHVGIIVCLEGKLAVVHSIPTEPEVLGGVQVEPLGAFLSDAVAKDSAYFRVDKLDKLRRTQLREYLQLQIGKPFDYQFRYSDDEAHYCTELAVKALEHVGINLASVLPRVHVFMLSEAAIPPDALAKSPDLREITYCSK